MLRNLTVILSLAILTIGTWWYLTQTPSAAVTTSIAALSAGNTTEGFTRATEVKPFDFPRDLGPHNDFQTEWWYYTGNLETDSGRRFGYQFTIFRRGLSPELAMTSSDWRTNQLYFAHFTISDIESETFYVFEKYSRGGAELAGAQGSPYEVWIENWQVREQPDGSIRMQASATDYADGGKPIALDLQLIVTQPPVAHGEQGLSSKGEGYGNASYYYSLVNQRTEGTITLGEQQYEVSGHSWKDHEYSTNILEENAVGWDWLSLTFDTPDPYSIMFGRVRDNNQAILISDGSWIQSDSSVQRLAGADVNFTAVDWWTSPDTGIRYPIAWELSIPSLELNLTGRAMMPNQELLLIPTYWEGAVEFTGELQGMPVSATGYVELTGYSP